MCDLVARFAFFYSDLGGRSQQSCKPTPRFLRPRPCQKKQGMLEVSSSKIDSDNNHDIEQEGKVALRRNTGRGVERLVGWIKLSKDDIESSGLQLDPDDDPPGHVGIVGWPASDDEIQNQSAQDQIIQSLIGKCCCKKLCNPIYKKDLMTQGD